MQSVGDVLATGTQPGIVLIILPVPTGVIFTAAAFAIVWRQAVVRIADIALAIAFATAVDAFVCHIKYVPSSGEEL